jgi:PAS domain S-box-containing protein
VVAGAALLAAGAVLAAWSVLLSVSVGKLRGQIAANEGLLSAIETVRGAADAAAPAGDTLRRAEAASPAVRGGLAGLTAALDELERRRGELAGAADGPQGQAAAQAFRDARIHVERAAYAAAVTIRGEQAALSSAVENRWRKIAVRIAIAVLVCLGLGLVIHQVWIEGYRTRRVLASLRESESRFRQFAENSDDVIWVARSHQAGVEYVSPAYERVWGRPCRSLYDNPLGWQEIIHPQDRPRVARSIADAAQSGYDEEYRIVRDNGTVRWIRDRGFPVRDEAGNFFRLAGIAQDVTDRKLAEEALRESEERFRSIFEHAGAGMATVGPDGRFLQVNAAMCRYLGYTEADLRGRCIADVTHPDDLAQSLQRLEEARSGAQQSIEFIKRYVRKDGRVVWGRVTSVWLYDPARRPMYGVTLIEDITEQRLAEDALRRSEERFRSIFQHAGAGMGTLGPDGRFIEVNAALCRFLGYAESELKALDIVAVTHPDDRPETLRRLEAVRAGRSQATEALRRYQRQDGSEVWGHVTSAWIFDGAGQPIYGVVLIQDLTEQQRAGRALREAKEELERRVATRTADLVTANEKLRREIAERQRAEALQRGWNGVLQRIAAGAALDVVLPELVRVVEAAQPDMIGTILLLDGRRLRHGAAPNLPDFYNQAVDGLEIGPQAGSCGAAAYTGRPVVVEDVTTHPNWTGFRELAARAGVRACWSQPIFSSTQEVLGTFAMYYRQPRGPGANDLDLIEAAAHVAGIAIERTLAERRLRESQDRLRTSDRMATLGTLVAGLGHDMNNVLFPLRCRLDALNWSALPADLRETLGSAHTAIGYLQQLSNGLRLFAADPERADAAPEVTSLSAWWSQIEPLLSRMVPDRVRLEPSIPGNLPLAAVAPHHLTQAVQNLVANAAEAMPSGGRVRVTARASDDGRQVSISVIDEGVGMAEEVRRRAFDPFYTTKKRSLSTGLGLSVVMGVVRRYHGTVSLDSRPGGGTTVELCFPAARRGPVPGPPPGEPGTRERAVVSLQDPRTAAWVTNILESAGYGVAVAGNGAPLECDIWVTDPAEGRLESARQFLADRAGRRIIALGPCGDAWSRLGAVVVEDAGNLHAIKSAVCEVTPVQR